MTPFDFLALHAQGLIVTVAIAAVVAAIIYRSY